MRRLTAVLFVAATGAWSAPVAAQDATPSPGPGIDVPNPEECRVESRPLAFYAQFVGTPAARDEDDDIDTGESLAVLPAGPPADAETVAASTATIREAIACVSGGDNALFLPPQQGLHPPRLRRGRSDRRGFGGPSSGAVDNAGAR